MPLAQRLLLLLTQAAWCLPFIMVTHCGATEGHRVMGWALYDKPDEWLFWAGIPLLLALGLAVRPWRPGPGVGSGAAGLGLRALVSALCLGGSALGPTLENIFSRVTPHLGWVVQLSAWGLLLLGYLAGGVQALRSDVDGPESTAEGKAGALLVTLAPLVSAIAALALGSESWRGLLLAGLLFSPPLALAMLGIGRREKSRADSTALWRGLVLLLAAGWVLLCVNTVLG